MVSHIKIENLEIFRKCAEDYYKKMFEIKTKILKI